MIFVGNEVILNDDACGYDVDGMDSFTMRLYYQGKYLCGEFIRNFTFTSDLHTDVRCRSIELPKSELSQKNFLNIFSLTIYIREFKA